MANKKITKDSILDCAVELIRQGDELSARNIAKRLGCSTQPIYSVFKNMAELEGELYLYIQRIHKTYIAQYAVHKGILDYKAFGMGFVKFAKIEKQLFSRLYIQKPFDRKCLEEDAYFIEVVKTIQEEYGISHQQAVQFHLDMTIYSYGLAVMQHADSDMSDDEISQRLTTQFRALYNLYFDKKD
ncbi:MAG: TetR/AcrR family transcriptional regulator [Clostridia bacterium]|nr:TetR/AcrR family transcriptional regulator [Clostridia bacterium]MDE7208836.1 TetR/AcrR family transcriptional regulator [Clostridia bacterium]